MKQTMPLSFHLLRHSFHGLRAISPALAQRLAERLFLKPPRHPLPPAEADALATGRAFRLPFEGHPLAAWAWGPHHGNAPTVLLLHGWGGRAGQLREVNRHATVPFASLRADRAPARSSAPGASIR